VGYWSAVWDSNKCSKDSLPDRKNFYLTPLNSAWDSGLLLGKGYEALALGNGDVDAKKITDLWNSLHVRDSELTYYKTLFTRTCVFGSICALGWLGWRLYLPKAMKSSSGVAIWNLGGC
jgi:hypothetical protein